MTRVYGNASEFAWVVPVPNLPEVTTGEVALFQDLQSMTRPVFRDRGDGWSCTRNNWSYDVLDGSPVEVIRDEMVGVYRVMVLRATEAPALVDSLAAWGFLHEQNIEAVTPAIEYYVEKSWYFVTMLMDGDVLDPEYPSWSYNRSTEPIRFSFSSPTPVYPLRISAVSASDLTDVYLYVKSQHRLDFSEAETLYANRLSAGELAEIRVHWPAAGAVLAEGDFLTKLHRIYRVSQMTTDIELVRHGQDEEYFPLILGSFSWTGLLMPGSVGFWLIWRRRKTIRVRK